MRDCKARERLKLGKGERKMRRDGGRVFGFLKMGDRILKLVVLTEE